MPAARLARGHACGGHALIVVTGGAGFIGSNIVAALNETGRRDVVICDRLGTGDKWRNLGKSTFADFVRPDELVSWLAGRRDVEAVIHMGAKSATTAIDGDVVIDANFVSSIRLLDQCAGQSIPLIYASSAAVYGNGEQGFEDGMDLRAMGALRPLNLYGWSKRQFDLVVADRFARSGPLPPRWSGLRFFNVFGPNESHKGDMRSVLAKMFPLAQSGDPISLFKSHRAGIADGDQRRDFIYVKDVVAVVLWALGPTGHNGIFNVGTGEARSFNALAASLCDALAMPRQITFADMPPAIRDKYQYFTQASLGRLREAGYAAPFTALEDAVSDYVGAYLTRADPYR